jgi:hypothetical protein
LALPKEPPWAFLFVLFFYSLLQIRVSAPASGSWMRGLQPSCTAKRRGHPRSARASRGATPPALGTNGTTGSCRRWSPRVLTPPPPHRRTPALPLYCVSGSGFFNRPLTFYRYPAVTVSTAVYR